MESRSIPPPETIRQRIRDCEQELRALRKLLRISLTLQTADQARERRGRDGGGRHAG